MRVTRRTLVVIACFTLFAFAAAAPVMFAAKPPKAGKSRAATANRTGSTKETDMNEPIASTGDDSAGLEKATFGSGCFWCSEAVIQQLKGVRSVVSGYSGGITKDPTYQEVCTGTTGHAEVIQINYDPQVISYPELLEVFWQTHDPTTLNRQGHDVGTQYRSVIFYHDARQKELAEHYKRKLEEEHAFRKPIVTEIAEFEAFYPAEDYHQNYYNLHKEQGYCAAVIRPKVSKVKKVFHDKLKEPVKK